MAKARRALISIAGGTAAVAVLGFVLFAVMVTRSARGMLPGGGETADGIVVLTGGEKRIMEAVRLLDNGKARRLLITGVNRKTSRDDVRRLVASRGRVFDCCVDIGYDALDTIGNADEARTWVQDKHFSSLIVVTASNHMPRSMAELRLALPETLLIPHPVVPNRLKVERWWLHVDAIRELAVEYVKFVPTAMRYGIVQVYRRFDTPKVQIQATQQLAPPPGGLQ